MVTGGSSGWSVAARAGVARTTATLALAGVAACGPLGENIHDAFNSREIGSYLSLGRAQGSDGSLVVHLAASQPEHAERIAMHVVRQNYATSALPIRVIVDPMVGEGERRVYRWDGRQLTVDTSPDGLPPRAHRPDADGAEASPH